VLITRRRYACAGVRFVIQSGGSGRVSVLRKSCRTPRGFFGSFVMYSDRSTRTVAVRVQYASLADIDRYNQGKDLVGQQRW
jgi:hypothetical protein